MTKRIRIFCAVMGCVVAPKAAFAVDGIVLINQTSALMGNVTPGDTPGFPITISQPGSYRLSSNLTVPDGNTTAIQVTGNNVTIDLNGFSIIGPVVCTGEPVTSCSPSTASGVGILTSSNLIVTVTNGMVQGMGVGLSLSGPSRVERVSAVQNNSFGILFQSSGNVVLNNTASFNGSAGIQSLIASSVIVGNVVIGNRGTGMSVSGAISGNVAIQNGSSGIQGNGTIRGNDVVANGTTGISVTCPTAILDNRSAFNPGANISTTFTGCVLGNNAAP
jgi:parallel beta-helix repeat protein